MRFIRRLLNRIRSFLGLTPKEQFDVYLPRERKIYSYFNGEKVLKADPMDIQRKLSAVSTELDMDLKIATSTEFAGNLPEAIMKNVFLDAEKARQNALKTLRGVFNVKTLDEGGLLDDEVFDVFSHFMIYVQAVKKNSMTSPITSKPSEDYKATSEDARPITNTSVSGLTENVPGIESPEPLPTEP